MMMEGYWDRLEKIKKIGSLLQRHPVPEEQELCDKLLSAVSMVEDALQLAMRTVAPFGQLWCGTREEAERNKMILAQDWDELFRAD